MEAEKILVIILAVALAIFIVLAVAIAVYVLKVVKSVRQITEQAEAAAMNFRSFSSTMRKAATPTAVSSIVGSMIKKYVKNNRK